MFPDGVLRADGFSLDDLAGYRTVVLPDCVVLTDDQARLLEAFTASGGHLVVTGRLGESLGPERRQKLLGNASAVIGTGANGDLTAALPSGMQVLYDNDTDVAVLIHRTENGAALHLLRYDYDRDADAMPAMPEFEVRLRLPFEADGCVVHSPAGSHPLATQTDAEGRLVLMITYLPLYCIAEIAGVDRRD
jgi:hypothetical protein